MRVLVFICEASFLDGQAPAHFLRVDRGFLFLRSCPVLHGAFTERFAYQRADFRLFGDRNPAFSRPERAGRTTLAGIKDSAALLGTDRDLFSEPVIVEPVSSGLGVKTCTEFELSECGAASLNITSKAIVIGILGADVGPDSSPVGEGHILPAALPDGVSGDVEELDLLAAGDLPFGEGQLPLCQAATEETKAVFSPGDGPLDLLRYAMRGNNGPSR